MIHVSGHFDCTITDPVLGIVDRWRCANGATVQGLTDLLNVAFGADAKNANYFVGLIVDATTVTLDPADTAASHAGWTESAAYSESVRQTLSFGVGANGVILSTAASFTMNAVTTLAGIFVSTSSTKSGTGGKLWATSLFTGGDRVLTGGQVFSATYQIEMADGG